jgi:hypothetical protein
MECKMKYIVLIDNKNQVYEFSNYKDAYDFGLIHKQFKLYELREVKDGS